MFLLRLIMREVFTEIEIHATPERVWKVLTDFKAYAEWNPFVCQISGDIQVGNKLDAVIKPPGHKAVKLQLRVVKYVPRREFRWQGNLGITGLFDGEQIFEIHSPAPHIVRFINRKVYQGLLKSIVLGATLEQTRRGFEEMNQAFKKRCET
jgi:hypothetical protein